MQQVWASPLVWSGPDPTHRTQRPCFLLSGERAAHKQTSSGIIEGSEVGSLFTC